MKVLGIDPGTHRVGWGVIEGNAAKQRHVASGCLDLPAHTEVGVYLHQIYGEVQKLCALHKPDLVCIEKLFFQTNAKTAITVAEARGVAILAITESGTPYTEYSPNTIKSAVTGNGASDKKQVERMVGLLLGNKNPKLDDTSDALAIAITGLILHKNTKL